MDWDTPLLLYLGQMVLWGKVPYVEIFDVNLPLTYWLNMAVLKVFGASDLVVRLADLACLTLICALTWGCLRQLGRRLAGVAAVSFVLLVFSFGNLLALQRDLLLIVPLAGACCVFLKSESPSRRTWILIGFCFGCVVLIKPQAMLGWLAFLFAAALEDAAPMNLGAAFRRSGWSALGLGLPVCLAAIWLVSLGAQGALLDLIRGYWPLFSELSGDQTVLAGFESKMAYRSQQLAQGLAGSVLLIPLAIGWWSGLESGREDARIRRATWLFVGLVVTQLLSVVTVGRFWPYHWLPCWWAMLCLASLALVDIRTRPLGVLTVSLMLLQLTLPNLSRFYQDLRFGHPQEAQGGLVREVTEFLDANLQPGDTVQPLDWTGGMIHAMLKAEARPATSFAYTYQFYHHVDEPYIQDLRHRFLFELEGASPRFILESHASRWVLRGPHTSRRFDDLELWIASRYKPAVREKGFTIYERVE